MRAPGSRVARNDLSWEKFDENRFCHLPVIAWRCSRARELRRRRYLAHGRYHRRLGRHRRSDGRHRRSDGRRRRRWRREWRHGWRHDRRRWRDSGSRGKQRERRSERRRGSRREQRQRGRERCRWERRQSWRRWSRRRRDDGRWAHVPGDATGPDRCVQLARGLPLRRGHVHVHRSRTRRQVGLFRRSAPRRGRRWRRRDVPSHGAQVR